MLFVSADAGRPRSNIVRFRLEPDPGVTIDAVERLPARQRAVLELRDVHGFSANEMCGFLKFSAANQRVLLHRARAMVRARVEEYRSEAAA